MSYLPDEEEKSERKSDRVNDDESRRHDDEEMGPPVNEGNQTPADPDNKARSHPSEQEDEKDYSTHAERIPDANEGRDAQSGGTEEAAISPEDEVKDEPQPFDGEQTVEPPSTTEPTDYPDMAADVPGNTGVEPERKSELKPLDQQDAAEPASQAEWIQGERREEGPRASGDEEPRPLEEKEAKPVTTEESVEEPGADEEKKQELGRKTLDGIEEILDSGEEGEAAEAEVREEAVDELAHIIEAIVFASDEPLTASTIKSVLDASHTFGRLNVDIISDRITALNNKYESEGSGFRIVEIANGYQFATRKEMAQWVSNLFKERSKRKLSMSALESLAIIAYKQPITKPEIESIRGVNVDYVLHSLLEKELVTVVGRAETVGRPLLYGTTQRFLKVFALKNLDDLPKLREIDEIIKEIKSKGTEESIQLEITAFGEESSQESKPQSETKPENS